VGARDCAEGVLVCKACGCRRGYARPADTSRAAHPAPLAGLRRKHKVNRETPGEAVNYSGAPGACLMPPAPSVSAYRIHKPFSTPRSSQGSNSSPATPLGTPLTGRWPRCTGTDLAIPLSFMTLLSTSFKWMPRLFHVNFIAQPCRENGPQPLRHNKRRLVLWSTGLCSADDEMHLIEGPSHFIPLVPPFFFASSGNKAARDRGGDAGGRSQGAGGGVSVGVFDAHSRKAPTLHTFSILLVPPSLSPATTLRS
jgi:hypothetical protein